MHWSVFQFIEAEQLQAEFSSFTEDISQSGWSDPTINGTTKSKCKSSSLQLFNQSGWNIREYITQDYSENDLQSILLFKMAFNSTYSSIKLQHLSHPQWVMSTSKTKAFSLSQNPMASVASKMKMQTKTFAACQVHRYLTGWLGVCKGHALTQLQKMGLLTKDTTALLGQIWNGQIFGAGHFIINLK